MYNGSGSVKNSRPFRSPQMKRSSGGNARQDMHLHALGAGQSDGCALGCFHALGSPHLQAQQRPLHVSMHVLGALPLEASSALNSMLIIGMDHLLQASDAGLDRQHATAGPQIMTC